MPRSSLARSDSRYRLRRVTQRLYRGFCRAELEQALVAPMFQEQQDAIWALYLGYQLLEEDNREKAVEYYEDFYETLDDEGDFKRDMMERCRDLPGA